MTTQIRLKNKFPKVLQDRIDNFFANFFVPIDDKFKLADKEIEEILKLGNEHNINPRQICKALIEAIIKSGYTSMTAYRKLNELMWDIGKNMNMSRRNRKLITNVIKSEVIDITTQATKSEQIIPEAKAIELKPITPKASNEIESLKEENKEPDGGNSKSKMCRRTNL